MFTNSLVCNPKHFLRILLYFGNFEFYSSHVMLQDLVQNEPRSFEIHTKAVTSKLNICMVISYFASRVVYLMWF